MKNSNNSTKYIPTSIIIERAKAKGYNFGKSNPINRLRYYIKIGILPHMKRKQRKKGLSYTEGFMPEYTLKLLLKIQKLQQSGTRMRKIKQIMQNQLIKLKQSSQRTNKKLPFLYSANASDNIIIPQLTIEKFIIPSRLTYSAGFITALVFFTIIFNITGIKSFYPTNINANFQNASASRTTFPIKSSSIIEENARYPVVAGKTTFSGSSPLFYIQPNYLSLPYDNININPATLAKNASPQSNSSLKDTESSANISLLTGSIISLKNEAIEDISINDLNTQLNNKLEKNANKLQILILIAILFVLLIQMIFKLFEEIFWKMRNQQP